MRLSIICPCCGEEIELLVSGPEGSILRAFDISQPSITTPAVTPEQLGYYFGAKGGLRNKE